LTISFTFEPQVSVSDHKELRKAKRSKRRSASPEEEEGVDTHIDRHEQQGWGIGPALTTWTIALLFPSPWKNEDFCCFVQFFGDVCLSVSYPAILTSTLFFVSGCATLQL